MSKRRNYHRQGDGSELVIIILYAVCAVLICIMAILVIKDKKAEKTYISEYMEQREQKIEERRITVKNSSIGEKCSELIEALDVLEGRKTGEIIISPEKFAESCSYSNSYFENSGVSYSMNYGLNDGDVLVLQFQAYTENGDWADISVRFDSSDFKMQISGTPRTFFIPYSGATSLKEIDIRIITDYVPTIIDSVCLVNYGVVDVTTLASGVYTKDTHTTQVLGIEQKIVDEGRQCLVKGDFLFSLSSDMLCAYLLEEDGTYELVGSYSSLGTARDMAFSKDKNAILVTSREYGLYILDITNPAEIKLLSHHDALEYVTGISVVGNYCFAFSRYFGVEILDISDLANPIFLNSVGSQREYQDGVVDGDYLYIGVYRDKAVDVWNIHDVMNPKLVSRIELEGQGQGLTVVDGILYVATGLLNAEGSNSDPVWNYNKGTGNGFEIYDVKNPARPEKLSVTKLDGRYWLNLTDIWDVNVSNGYAFVSDMLNGVWVYELSDLRNPKCETVYTIVIGENQDVDSSKYILPYDGTKEERAYALHTICVDGSIYISTKNNGIFCVADDRSIQETVVATSGDYIYKKDALTVSVPKVKGYDVDLYSCGESFWSVAVHDSYIYAAAGDGGIIILDMNLNEVARFSCDTSVRDIKIVGEYLYAAEAEGGMGIYRIEGESIKKVSQFDVNPSNACITQLGVTNDGNYAIAKSSINSYKVIDMTDRCVPVEMSFDGQKSIGLSYYRTLCNRALSNGWVGIYGDKEQHWYSSENGTLRQVSILSSEAVNNIEKGISAYKNLVLTMGTKGYYYFNPATDDAPVFVPVEGATAMNGKSASSDSLLVTSDSRGGNVAIVNIQNIDRPRLVSQFKIQGNPDVAYVSDEMILIPCRYYGLLQLKKQ